MKPYSSPTPQKLLGLGAIPSLLLALNLLSATGCSGSLTDDGERSANTSLASSTGSCRETCGSRSSGGCWCDELCAHYGDCCADKHDVCGGEDCSKDTHCGSVDCPVEGTIGSECVDGICVEPSLLACPGVECTDTSPCAEGYECNNFVCLPRGQTCDALGSGCHNSPPSVCTNNGDVRVYADQGTCQNGLCSYESKTKSCPYGCADGACLDLFDEASCEGPAITPQEAMDLLGGSDHYFLAGFENSYGFVSVAARRRFCAEGACGSWEDASLSGYGRSLRPELRMANGKFYVRLDRECQGSYGHGTSCGSPTNEALGCAALPRTDQCAGWGKDDLAGFELKGTMTNHCLRLVGSKDGLVEIGILVRF